VAAGRGELERSAGALLAADVGEVGPRLRRRPTVGRGLVRQGILLAAEVRNRLREVTDRDGLDAGERGLRSRLGGADQARAACSPRALGNGDRPADGPHPPVEGQLAVRRVLREPLRGKLPRRGEDRERDREVEARALLAQPGRREVDGDAAARPEPLG
jgi:hypothetical protein